MNEEGKNGYFSTDSLILDVFDLLRALRKGIWLILLAGIIGGLLANLGTRLFISPTYRTSFTAYVNNRTNLEGTTSVTSSDLSAAKSLANTYARILTSRSMINLAAEKAGMQDMENMLGNAVAVSVSPDTDLLTGETTLGAAIRKLSKYGIHVLPAGSIPPEPTVLLESQQMQTLINGLKKYYQYIIIDLPPVTTVTDAAIMSRHIDGFLLVARNGTSEHRAINEMMSTLHLAGANIIGFVYNDVSTQDNHYYGKYYKSYAKK